MKNIISYFDRAYIINLMDRPDRRRDVEQEFRRIGIDIPNEKVRFYSATRPAEKGPFHEIGARGTFSSHREVLNLAFSDGLRNVLVFEDDVVFRQVPETFGERLIRELSQVRWDVMYFGYLEPSDSHLTGPLIAWTGSTLGGHFYAVNGPFIGEMIQYMNACELRPRGHPEGGPMGRDGAYNHIRYINPNIRVFLTVPKLAFQRSSRTDVHPLNVLDRIVWLRPIMRTARFAKTQWRMALDKRRFRSLMSQKK